MDPIDYPILQHQADFLQSNAMHTALIGGFGSGKTEGGFIKLTSKKLELPGIPVAYYMPTYGLIEDVAFDRLSNMMEERGIEFHLNKSKYFFDTAFGRIIMRSLHNPDRIAGYEVGYSVVDETDLLPQTDMVNVFNKVIARNRRQLPDGMRNQTDVVGTPEGFKFAYKFFVKEAKGKDRQIIKAQTEDNPFLPDNYMEVLLETYTPEQLEAYTKGEFVNLTSGTVYYKFNRTTNSSKRRIRIDDTLHIGMDFNVTKMNAIVHVIDDVEIHTEAGIFVGTRRIKTAVDEIVNAYDTSQMIDLIKAKYPSAKIVIYPDASGDNRKSSGKSDIELLKEARFVVRKLKKNPFVKDRVNKMNMAFMNNNQVATYFVNSDTCPNYVECLEMQTYKNGEPDKSTGYDHAPEAGGYFIYYDSKPITEWGSSQLT